MLYRPTADDDRHEVRRLLCILVNDDLISVTESISPSSTTRRHVLSASLLTRYVTLEAVLRPTHYGHAGFPLLGEVFEMNRSKGKCLYLEQRYGPIRTLHTYARTFCL